MLTKRIKQLTNSELSLFCEQFAMTLDAGLNHTDGINVMLEDAENSEGKRILEAIIEELQNGKKFHEAIEATGVFPGYCKDMIVIGESSGKLDEVMHSLANYYEREQTISDCIKNALKYPFLILIMMLVVIMVLIIKVMPVFEQVFIQLGTEIGGLSKGLINMGKIISTYALAFVLLIGLFIVLYFYFSKTQEGKIKFKNFGCTFFATKGIYEKIAAGQFAGGMALAINAGLRPNESIEMVKNILNNKQAEMKCDKCLELLRTGESFSDSLVKAGIFSNLYSRMIAVSGKSGNVDKALEKIAQKYEDEINVKINTMITILEPTLVIIFSIVVCLILLSVMLPLMSIMSSIG